MNDSAEMLYRVDITERQETDKTGASWTIRYSWDISEAAPYDGELQRGLYLTSPSLSGEPNVSTVIGESAEEATAVALEFAARQKTLADGALNMMVENMKAQLRA